MKRQEMELRNSVSNIILAQKGNCEKVIFDLSLLKKQDKIRNVYHIPPEETIIAFCKSNVPLFSMTTEGLIFTNQALYFFPGHTLKSGMIINHIVFTAMDSYLFTQDGNKGVVYAQTRSEKIRIMGPAASFSSYNVAGTEIRKILRDIQNHLFKQSPLAKSRFDALATAFLKKLRTEMGIFEITKHADAILYGLMKFPDHADAAAMLKAEYLFREFLPEKYEKYARALPRIVSKGTRERIINIPEFFSSNYICMLKQLDNDYKYDDLAKIYQRINGHEWKDVDTATICAYLSIRMNSPRKLNEALSVIRKRDGDAAVNSIEYFKGMHNYHFMQSVYAAIKNGENLPSGYTHFRDGVGLTPLHYAILLKNEKVILEMLEKSEWIPASPFQSDNKYYHYIIPAYGKQLVCFNDILLKTVGRAVDLISDIRLLMKKKKFWNFAANMNRFAIVSQYYNYLQQETDDRSFESVQEDIAKAEDNLVNIQNNADCLSKEIESYIEELEELLSNAPDLITEILDEARYSDDPLVRYLYRLYFEPDFFEQVLFATQNNQPMHLYVHKGFYFVAPEFAEINLPPLEVQSSQKKNATKAEPKKRETPRNTPIYGNSWFSPKAHRDADVLKSEYRKLAKQYHPDVSDLEDSTRLFQNISAEYKDLLEGLNKN